MQTPQVKTVRSYMAAGHATILSTYGRADYDDVMNKVIIPGFTDVLRTKIGDGVVDELAGDYDQMVRLYPEAFGHLVVMAVSLGIGFAAMEEIR